jgi:hypothetical protein
MSVRLRKPKKRLKNMPPEEIFHKFKHGIPMSNGRKIKSLAQAKAIASQYSGKGEEKKTGREGLKKRAKSK